MPWKTSDKVRKAVDTVARMDRNNLTLPDKLVESYQELINESKPHLVALFYQGISEKCPELLKHWAKEKESD
jgi:hypothetical protein